MNCPNCGSPTKIVDTEKYDRVVVRIRKYIQCGASETTEEVPRMVTMEKVLQEHKKEKRQIDWEAINREYRVGILPVREIATMHGVSHTAIQKRAKKFPDQWKRDLTKKVQAEIARKLVADEVATADEGEIIEEAAERSLAIIKKHRKCLARLGEMEAKLLAELHDNSTKLWIGQNMGKIITKEVPIPLTERAAALLALVNAMSKRIKMERQAFGIADHFKPQQEEVTEIRIICVAAPNREDEYEPPKQIPNEARLLLPDEKL